MMKRMTAFVVLSLIFEICNGQRDLFELSVIHMNSFHARFDEIYPDGSTCHPGDECIGGLARVVTEAKRIKKETGNSIFLNAGNNYQGTIWYNYHKWEAMSFFMNMLQYDAMTIGPHDFADGIDGLVPFLKDVQAPVVLTNIDDTGEPNFQGLTHRSTIIIRNGRKIGVIAVAVPKGIGLRKTGKLQFVDPVYTINQETMNLKNHGVNIIVVLSNSGVVHDKRIAAECVDVDLIVRGNGRYNYDTDSAISRDKKEAKYPFLVIEKFWNETTRSEGLFSSRVVLTVHAAAFTQYLGHISVRFDRNGRIVDWKSEPIFLGRNIIPDPQIIEALKPWKDEVDAVGNFVIGITRRRLVHRGDLLRSSLANLITDAMVECWAERRRSSTHWTYPAASFIMPNYMWFPIGRRHITDYNITLSDLMTAIPTVSTWDVVEIYGNHIIRMLEWSVAYMDSDGKGWHRFLHWSGLKVEFDLKRPAYHRLVRAMIMCQECEVPIFQDISSTQRYRVVVDSSYLEQTKQGFIFNEPYFDRKVGKRNQICLIEFFRRHSPVASAKDHRLDFLGSFGRNKGLHYASK